MKTKTSLTSKRPAKNLLLLLVVFLLQSSYTIAQISVYEILPSQINVGSVAPDTFKIVVKGSTTTYLDRIDITLAENLSFSGGLVLASTTAGTGWRADFSGTSINSYVTASTPSGPGSIRFTFQCSSGCPFGGTCSSSHCPYTFSASDSLVITYYTLSKCTLTAVANGTMLDNDIAFRDRNCGSCTDNAALSADNSPYTLVYPDISFGSGVTPAVITPYVGRQNLARTVNVTNGSLLAADSVYLTIMQEPEILNDSTFHVALPVTSGLATYTEHFSIGSCSPSPDSITRYSAYWQSSYATYTHSTDVCQTKITNANISVVPGAPVMQESHSIRGTPPDYCNDTIGHIRTYFINNGFDAFGDSTGYASGLELYLSYDQQYSKLDSFYINGHLVPDTIIERRRIPPGPDSLYATIIRLDKLTSSIYSFYGLSGLYDINRDSIYDDLFKGDTITIDCRYFKRFDNARSATCGFNSTPTYITTGASYYNMCGDAMVMDSISSGLGEHSQSISSGTVCPLDIANGQTKTFGFTHVHELSESFGPGCNTDSVYIIFSRPAGYMIANYNTGTGLDNGSVIIHYINSLGSAQTDTLNAQYFGLDSILIPIGSAAIFQDRVPSIDLTIELTFQCNDYVLDSTLASFGELDFLHIKMFYKCSSGCNKTEDLGCGDWICVSHPCGPCGVIPNSSTDTDPTLAARTNLGYVIPSAGYYTVSQMDTAQRVLPSDSIRLDAAYNGDTICITLRGKIPSGMVSSWVQIRYLTYPVGNNILNPLFATTNAHSVFPCGGLDSLTTDSTVSPPLYIFNYYFSPLCGGSWDTLRAYFVVKDNILTGQQPIVQLRGDYFAVSLTDTIHTCDTYGVPFTTLKTNTYRDALPNIDPFQCGFSGQLVAGANSAVSGVMNFPNEFRPQIFIKDTFRLVLPPGTHYALGSSEVSVDTSSTHVLQFSIPDPSSTGGTPDTLTWVYDWPVANVFKNGGIVSLSFGIKGECDDPDSYLTHAYQKANFVLMPSGAEDDLNNSVYVHRINPTLELNILSPTQDAVRRNISWNIDISNYSDTSVSVQYLWLAWETRYADSLRFDSARVSGSTINLGTANYGVIVGDSVVINIAALLSANSDTALTIYGHSLHCASETSHEDSVYIFGGWNCAGYPTNGDSAHCPLFSGWLKMRTEDAEMDWDVVHTSEVNFGQRFTDTITIKSIAEGVMDSIFFWVDTSSTPGLVLDSIRYVYLGDTTNITGSISTDTLSGNIVRGWNIDHLALADTGLVGTAYPNVTSNHANEISILLYYHNNCNFLVGPREIDFHAYGRGATKCDHQELVDYETLLVDTIYVHDLSISGPDTVCTNGSVTLTAIDPGITSDHYQWYVSGILLSGDTSQTLTTDSSGLYSVIITDLDTCTYSAYHHVTINPLPVANAGTDATICNGNNTTLGASSVAGCTYSWSPTSGLSSSSISNPNVHPSTTTNYTLTVTITATGCHSSDSVRVTVNPLPGADAGSDVSICLGASATLGNSAVAGNTYVWSPTTNLSSSTISNPVANPLTTTTYTVTAKIAATGCESSDSVKVTVNPLPDAHAGNDTTVCPGSSVTLGVVSASGHTYSWSPTTGLSNGAISNPVATSSTNITRTYVLTETISATGCQKRDTVIVNFLDTIVPTISCHNDTLYLDVSGHASITYLNVYTSSSDNCGIDSLWVTPDSFTAANAGDNTVTIYAIDRAGNIGTCNATVVILIPSSPGPSITTDFSTDCVIYNLEGDAGVSTPVIQSDSCWHVCEYSPATYITPYHTGSVYHWLVTGDYLSCTSLDTNFVTLDWGAVGSAVVEVTEQNYSGTVTASHCIRIIEKPTASALTSPSLIYSGGAVYLYLCRNQTADFTGIALPANPQIPILSWFWSFGDGMISLEQNPHHTYASQGTYLVELTVANQCGCKDIFDINVVVQDDDGPMIECNTPVCANSTSHYYAANSTCRSNNWSVLNGTIADTLPYGPNITVHWGDGNSGPGIVTLFADTDCYACYTPASMSVPILPVLSPVTGHSIVCRGSYERYSVPEVPGTIYTWSLSSAIGTITQGQGTHSIEIHFTSAPGSTAILSVAYENEYLGCSGSGLMNIEIRDRFVISSSSNEICAGGAVIFYSYNPSGVDIKWKLTQNTDTTYLGSSHDSIVVAPWSGAGAFIIYATDSTGAYCENTEFMTFKVDDGPPAPAMPSGDSLVCGGTPHVYHLPPAGAGYRYLWHVTNGTPLSGSGNSFNVQWNDSDSHLISVKRVAVVYPYCESGSTVMPVNKKVYFAPVIAGNTNVCINTTQTYSISNSTYHHDQIEWSINPPSAGSITSGQHTTSVNILWNNTPQSNVLLHITTVVCGVPHDLDADTITLVGIPSVQIHVSQDTICENIPDTFSVVGSPSGSYLWNFGDGSPADTLANAVHSYSAGGSSVTFTATVQITSSSCVYSQHILIQVNPGPGAPITHSGTCPDYLLATPAGSFTYAWQHPFGTVIGTLDTLSIDTLGTWYLVKTNSVSGCSSTNSILVTCAPDSGSPGGCLPLDSVTAVIDSVHINCTSAIFFGSINTTPPATYESFQWDFGDGNSVLNNFSTGNTYSSPGVYDVCLTAFHIDSDTLVHCTKTCQAIVIPLKADFKTAVYCSPTAYNIGFIDYSTYHGSPINSWHWYVNGTLFSSSPDTVVASTYLGAGIDTITLVVSNGTNSCERTILFNVPTPPNPAFTITSTGPYCEAISLVQFTATDATPNSAQYFWAFGDISYYSSYSSNQADRVYDAGNPSYHDTLTITDPFGCTYSSTGTVTVNNNGLGGQPSSDVRFCPGDSSYLYFITSSGTPINYLWTNGVAADTNWVSIPGEYNVTVYDALGCNFMSQFSAYSSNYNVPDPVIGGRKKYCTGDKIILYGYQGNSITYHWIISGAGIDTDSANVFIDSLAAGSYVVTLSISAASGSDGSDSICSQSITDTVKVNAYPDAPDITADVDPPCEGQAVTLTVNNAGIADHVNWSTGESATSISTYNADIFRATITDANGCSSHSDFTVNALPDFGFLISGCFDICHGTTQDTIKGNHIANYESWTWTVDTAGAAYYTNTGSGYLDDLILTSYPPGSYTIYLSLTGLDGCSATSTPIYLTIEDCNTPNLRVRAQFSCRFENSQGTLYHSFDIGLTSNCHYGVYPVLTSTSGTLSSLSFSLDSFPIIHVTGFYTSTGADSVAYLSIELNDPLDSTCHGIETLPFILWTDTCNTCALKDTIKLSCKLFDTEGNPYYFFSIHHDFTCNVDSFASISFDAGLLGDVSYSSPDPPHKIISGKLRPLSSAGGYFNFAYNDFPDSTCFCYSKQLVEYPTDTCNVDTCGFRFKINDKYCIGYDAEGNSVYEIQMEIEPSYGVHTFLSSQNADISGAPGYFGAGVNFFSCIITKHPGVDDAAGFCLRLIVWNDSINVVCADSFCIQPFPDCASLRLAAPLSFGEGRGEAKTLAIEQIKNLYLELVPNPASDKVSVRYQMNAASGTLELINIQGKLMEKMNLNQSTRAVDISTSDFSPGLYFVVLKGNDGKQMVKKLAVIR